MILSLGIHFEILSYDWVAFAKRTRKEPPMRRGTVAILAALIIAGVGAEASAQYAVTPGTDGYERVTRGVFDLGTEHLLLVHFLSSSEPAASDAGLSTESMYVAYMGGLVPRYFLLDNFAIGMSLNIFYQSNTITISGGGHDQTITSDDLGFIGFLMANYYIRLGYSLFFKPGIGVGGFYASREAPLDTLGSGVELESDIYGFAGRVDLGLVYYAGQHFNLRAGIDILIRAGYESAPNGEGDSFYSVDAAFGAGLGYSF